MCLAKVLFFLTTKREFWKVLKLLLKKNAKKQLHWSDWFDSRSTLEIGVTFSNRKFESSKKSTWPHNLFKLNKACSQTKWKKKFGKFVFSVVADLWSFYRIWYRTDICDIRPSSWTLNNDNNKNIVAVMSFKSGLCQYDIRDASIRERFWNKYR